MRLNILFLCLLKLTLEVAPEQAMSKMADEMPGRYILLR